MIGVTHFTDTLLKAVEDELTVRVPFVRIETELISSFCSTGTPSYLPRMGPHFNTV